MKRRTDNQVKKIEREIKKEGLSWMVSGSFVNREIKAGLAVICVVGFMALVSGSRWEIVGWGLIAAVSVWLVFVFVVGTFFVAKQMDRQHDKFARRFLSKEYWKR